MFLNWFEWLTLNKCIKSNNPNELWRRIYNNKNSEWKMVSRCLNWREKLHFACFKRIIWTHGCVFFYFACSWPISRKRHANLFWFKCWLVFVGHHTKTKPQFLRILFTVSEKCAKISFLERIQTLELLKSSYRNI